MRSAFGTPSHLFTAAQMLQSVPIACHWTAMPYFLSTPSSTASDIMHLGQLVGTSLPLSASSSRAPLRSLPMENSSKYSNSVKISDKRTVHCGWRGCAGSCPGTENAIVYGTICESPSSNEPLHPTTYLFLAAPLMFSSGSWGSIGTTMHPCHR